MLQNNEREGGPRIVLMAETKELSVQELNLLNLNEGCDGYIIWEFRTDRQLFRGYMPEFFGAYLDGSPCVSIMKMLDEKNPIISPLRFGEIADKADEWRQLSEKYANTNPVSATFTSVLITLKLCTVLNCANVIIQKTEAAKRSIMQKKGPKYYFDYHTLMVDSKTYDSEPMGGTHASPITHLRRGHYRNLKNGNRIWINDTVVNEGNCFVSKDYKLGGESNVTQ